MKQEELCGYIERITFHNPENGFTVARLKAPHLSDLICVVGSLPAIQPGETVRLQGLWQNNPVHGRQFSAQAYQVEAPSDIIGIQKYLESGLIKGIGPVFAKRIVDAFGVGTLNVIDQTPEKLLHISGLGHKRLEKVKSCWAAQKSIREVMIFLQTYGVSPTFANRIFKCYGEAAIQTMRQNPYSLARDVFGIGFKTADRIAEKMNIPKDSPQRIEAGIEYV